MQDLNDLYYFAEVVDHGGFAPAGRAIGIPKSKLSRRIALLEERLGVRLIQRSTRRFAVTRNRPELLRPLQSDAGGGASRRRKRSTRPAPNRAASCG